MTVLGKRKARATAPAADPKELEDAQAIFRRHFEAQFAPLPDSQEGSRRNRQAKDEHGGDGDSEDDGHDYGSDDDELRSGDEEGDASDWSGLSEDASESESEQGEGGVQVVDHSKSNIPQVAAMSKRELKAYMSSRPPDHTSIDDTAAPQQSSTSKKSSTDLPEDAPSLLAQDLELRRLISESHLLRSVASSGAADAAPKPFAAGRNRVKALDLRFQALGSKSSIYKQDNVPMKLRQKTIARAEEKEAKRRQEARENGIILEREKTKGHSGSKAKKRRKGGDIAVDRPGVGRLRGAELRISERDVRQIENTRDTFGRRRR